ncbi:MAG: putative B6 ABC transporter substrate-binding protein [Solirubrobacterales bacterium]
MEARQAELQRGRGGRWGRGPRLLALVATLLLAAGLAAGCGDDDDDDGDGAGEAAISAFGIVAPEEGNDFGWNQQAVEASEQVASDLGVELEVADGVGYEGIPAILRELSTGDAEFIVAQASGYNTQAPEVAAQTGVPALVWDNPEANEPGVSANAGTASQEGAYLAGVLAANTTESGTLGIVISADDTNWNKQAGGFVAGARSVDPEVEIQLAQIGPAGYADAAGGRRVTAAVIADGADVVFGQGDGSSFGMIQAVENADGVSFIDVIGDKTSIDEQGVLLSSVLWSFDGLYEDAIADIGEGTFGEQGYELDLENGGISLLRTDQIDDETWSEIQEIRDQIIAGEIDVPLTEERSQVDDLIRQG